MVGMSYRDPTTKQLVKLPIGCAGGGAPVGFVGPYMGSVAPVGWVICDGRAHNSPALQTLLGSGNTPDLRGRFILAASPTHAAKTTGGAESHKFLISAGTGIASGTNLKSETDLTEDMPPFYAMVYIIKAFAESANGGITLTDADVRYVNVDGDTMVGNLTIDSTTFAELIVDSGSDADTSGIRIKQGGVNKWLLSADSANRLALARYDKTSGAWQETALNVNGDTGLLSVKGDPTAALGVATKQYVDNGGVWTPYTPTVGGFSVGNGGSSGAYCRIGNLVFFKALFVLGSSTTGPTSTPSFTLPVTKKSSGDAGAHYAGVFFDSSASIVYQALARTAGSSGSVALSVLGTNGGMVTPTASVPFTWAVNDRVEAYGVYEAA